MADGTNDFAKRLTHLRERAGWTVYRLSKKSGISPQGIAKLERGEREPAWGTVVALAGALGVSLSAFDPVPPPAGEQSGESPPVA